MREFHSLGNKCQLCVSEIRDILDIPLPPTNTTAKVPNVVSLGLVDILDTFLIIRGFQEPGWGNISG